jgi:hypothetical protein
VRIRSWTNKYKGFEVTVSVRDSDTAWTWGDASIVTQCLTRIMFRILEGAPGRVSPRDSTQKKGK